MSTSDRTRSSKLGSHAAVAPRDEAELDEWILGSDAERSWNSDDEDGGGGTASGAASGTASGTTDKPGRAARAARVPHEPRPVYFDWRATFPELAAIHASARAIRAEAEAMERALRYTPWPEANLYNRMDQAGDWKVVPLLYTVRADRRAAREWVVARRRAELTTCGRRSSPPSTRRG